MVQKLKKVGQGCLMALGGLFIIIFVVLFIQVANKRKAATVAPVPTVPTYTATAPAKIALPTVTPEPPTATPIPTITNTPKPTLSPDEIKATAIALPPYKDLLRNIEDHMGDFVYFEGVIAQTMNDEGKEILRVQIKDGNVIYVVYSGRERFLKTDIVAIWGTVTGIESSLTVRLVWVEEPRIHVKFIELLSE